MRLSEVDDIRVRLEPEAERRLWDQISSTGVKEISSQTGFPASSIYNWKSKNSFIPLELVEHILNSYQDKISCYKGNGRSKPVRDPELPLRKNQELLTRIEVSVNVNSEGIPVYQTDDIGLIERFSELLESYGEVPYSIYNREIYELRYPKYLNRIFQSFEFQPDKTTLVDEKAEFKDGSIMLDGEEVNPGSVGRLYHREKRYRKALITGNETKILRLLSEENRRTRSALNQ